MERREHRRRRFWLPVEMTGVDGGVAICHDASDVGLLLACRSQPEIGAPVEVTLRIPPGGPVVVPVGGKVVRAGPNEQDPEGLWPYSVAMQFDEPVEDLEAYLAQIPTPAS